MDESEQYKITNFTNIDSEDYVGMWGGKEQVFKAHKTVQLVNFLADHYAFHLAQKILIGKGQDFGDEGLIKELTAKILGGIKVEVSAPQEVESVPEFEDLNAPVETAVAEPVAEPVKVVKKMGRPKKVVA